MQNLHTVTSLNEFKEAMNKAKNISILNISERTQFFFSFQIK
jgi:hypothetical protein